MSPLLRFGREIGQVIWKYFKLISQGGEKKENELKIKCILLVIWINKIFRLTFQISHVQPFSDYSVV